MTGHQQDAVGIGQAQLADHSEQPLLVQHSVACRQLGDGQLQDRFRLVDVVATSTARVCVQLPTSADSVALPASAVAD